MCELIQDRPDASSYRLCKVNWHVKCRRDMARFVDCSVRGTIVSNIIHASRCFCLYPELNVDIGKISRLQVGLVDV